MQNSAGQLHIQRFLTEAIWKIILWTLPTIWITSEFEQIQGYRHLAITQALAQSYFDTLKTSDKRTIAFIFKKLWPWLCCFSTYSMFFLMTILAKLAPDWYWGFPCSVWYNYTIDAVRYYFPSFSFSSLRPFYVGC